ncbi:hypothetical protein SDC9_184532 [bioreactor metagenome]|uniref:Uncharacterized protein n=1 Tax=bioreactor metagenome TaxID=1076179 RepID=A0A645HE75_9ZZZZ
MIATNLNYTNPDLLKAKWFSHADVSKFVAYLIATLNHDRSLSALLNPYNRVKGLLNRYAEEQAKNGLRFV